MFIRKSNPALFHKPIANIIDDIFNKSISDVIGADYTLTSPSANISEDENAFHIQVAVPGIEKDDFKIAIEKDHLVVSAEKSQNQELKEDGKWTRKEFNYGVFKRSFYLDDSINTDEISAEYHNGILMVLLPKKTPAAQPTPKTITVK